MNPPQRPLLGFLWPRPDPLAPVDEAAVQARLVRVMTRGPLRLLTLTAATLLCVLLASTAVLTAASAPLSAAALVGAALAATMICITLRGWVLGTYVNDHGIVVDTMVRRVRIPWAEVSRLICADEGVPLLGTPLRVPGRRMIVHTAHGARIGTHVYTHSPDVVGRSDAFAVAGERLENWRRRA